MRTLYCGELTGAEIGKTVNLFGWVDRRRDHGGVIFGLAAIARALSKLSATPNVPPSHIKMPNGCVMNM